jgi:hypothetical protein
MNGFDSQNLFALGIGKTNVCGLQSLNHPLLVSDRSRIASAVSIIECYFAQSIKLDSLSRLAAPLLLNTQTLPGTGELTAIAAIIMLVVVRVVMVPMMGITLICTYIMRNASPMKLALLFLCRNCELGSEGRDGLPYDVLQ